MEDFLTIEDIDVTGKTVLLRGDFNVPLDKQSGQITEQRRLEAALPTIEYLLLKNAKVIACSHMGRPKGEKVPALSLKIVADKFSQLVDNPVKFVDDCIGGKADKAKSELNPGEMLILENLRFYPQEKANDVNFSQQLAGGIDIYVNDAFGTAHRAHASTVGVANIFKEKGLSLAGFLMIKEIKYLSAAIKHYTRPVIAILGGSKIKGKIELIENFSSFVDSLLIGGGMVYTFLKAQGYNIGKSILDEDSIPVARNILSHIGREAKVNFIISADSITAEQIKEHADCQVYQNDEIPDQAIGVDIGPLTVKIFKQAIENAKTIIWNGPMGIFEIDCFAEGTRQVAQAVARATDQGALSILGGGDTEAAVAKFDMEDEFSHISTGGGASLEYMSGRSLPALQALNSR
ncbi:MAG: phosphoglycerate kinase [bacterium]